VNRLAGSATSKNDQVREEGLSVDIEPQPVRAHGPSFSRESPANQCCRSHLPAPRDPRGRLRPFGPVAHRAELVRSLWPTGPL